MAKVWQIQIKLVCSRLCKLVSPKARNSHSPPSCFILYPLPIYRSSWSVLWNMKGERELTPIRLLLLGSLISGCVNCIGRECVSHNCALLDKYTSLMHSPFFFNECKIYKYIFCTYEKLFRNMIILCNISRNQVTMALIVEVICVLNSCAL